MRRGFANFKTPTSNFQAPTTNFQPPTSNFQPPASNRNFQGRCRGEGRYNEWFSAQPETIHRSCSSGFRRTFTTTSG